MLRTLYGRLTAGERAGTAFAESLADRLEGTTIDALVLNATQLSARLPSALPLPNE